MKLSKKGYHGMATLLNFADCQGILVAANVRDLRKLARGFFFVEFDPKKAKRATLSERK